MDDTPHWLRSRAGRTLPRSAARLVGSLPLPFSFCLSFVVTSTWGALLCWIAYTITALAT